LSRAIAPVLSHLAEDIWQFLPYSTGKDSVFESGWVKLDEQWRQPALSDKWTKLRDLRGEANQVLEQARTAKMIGSSLEAKLLLYVADGGLRSTLEQMNTATGNQVDELRYLFLTSQVELLSDAAPLAELEHKSETIGIVKADGCKCDRCWNYSTRVGLSVGHPLLCDRCEGVV
jgi:isoleucyl-tRNA synthetase